MLAHDVDDASGQLVGIAFPRWCDGRWNWEELAVQESSIAGYGLLPRQSDHLDWCKLPFPIHVPLLGRETEVNSQEEADIFARVLQGGSLCTETYAKCMRVLD